MQGQTGSKVDPTFAFATANCSVTDAYSFRVTVSDDEGSALARSSFASVTITFVSIPVPLVTLSASGSNINPSDTVQLIASSQVDSINGLSVSVPTWTWTCPQLNLNDASLWLSPMNGNALVIRPGILLSDTDYSFTVTVDYHNPGLASGLATLLLRTNRPPTGGYCDAPANITFGSSLQIRCFDWTDSEWDFPLMFQFGYISSTSGSFIQLTNSFQTSNQASVYLPVGLQALEVRIQDQSFGVTRYSLQTQVLNVDDSNLAAVTDELASKANDALRSGDLGTMSQLVGSVLSTQTPGSDLSTETTTKMFHLISNMSTVLPPTSEQRLTTLTMLSLVANEPASLESDLHLSVLDLLANSASTRIRGGDRADDALHHWQCYI